MAERRLTTLEYLRESALAYAALKLQVDAGNESIPDANLVRKQPKKLPFPLSVNGVPVVGVSEGADEQLSTGFKAV